MEDRRESEYYIENQDVTKVFVVGTSDAEANTVCSVHKTYKGALDAWNSERKRLLRQFEQLKFHDVSRGSSHDYDNVWNGHIDKLLCEDPTKMDNYPLEEPYITEYNLED